MFAFLRVFFPDKNCIILSFTLNFYNGQKDNHLYIKQVVEDFFRSQEHIF